MPGAALHLHIPTGPVSVMSSCRQVSSLSKGLLEDLREHPTTKPLDLDCILSHIPPKFWSPPPKPHGCIVFGLSPRSVDLTHATKQFPEFAALLARYVRVQLPQLQFSTIGVRIGGKLSAHRDLGVLGASGVLSGMGSRSCGFWRANAAGSFFEEFEGRFVLGEVCDLRLGALMFDPRQPHCGFQMSQARRISVSAFQLSRIQTPPRDVLDRLAELGYFLQPPTATPIISVLSLLIRNQAVVQDSCGKDATPNLTTMSPLNTQQPQAAPSIDEVLDVPFIDLTREEEDEGSQV